MPKTKDPLPGPKTQPRRRPRGRATTQSRADAGADVGETLHRGTSRDRRKGLQRIARDAKSSLDRYRVRPAGQATGTPKKKASPDQLKRKARTVARTSKDAPRRG